MEIAMFDSKRWKLLV